MVELAGADHQYIDKLLYLLKEGWEELPQVASEIDQWDTVDRVDFLGEWPLEEERLRQLEQYAEQDVLSQDQLARYEELKEVIERNRPVLQRLRASEGVSTSIQEDEVHQNTRSTGLAGDEAWKGSEEHRYLMPQSMLSAEAKTLPGMPFPSSGLSYSDEGNELLSGNYMPDWSVTLPKIEMNDIHQVLAQLSLSPYVLQDTIYTTYGFAPKLQATTRRGNLFRAELPSLVSDPGFWCNAITHHNVVLDSSEIAKSSINVYSEAQQEIAGAGQGVAPRGTDDNLDYRRYNEPRKRLESASAA